MYEPYKTDGLKKLMQKAYLQGWYGGIHELLTVTMKGGFEAFYGRATETWEHRFYVSFRLPHPNTHNTSTEFKGEGKTLDEACMGIVRMLEKREIENAEAHD